MTDGSQTLTNLANSAKASQKELENTLIEIHKKSVDTIESELTKIYEEEISEIKNDTKRQLLEIVSEMKQTKDAILNEMEPTIIQRLLSGMTAIILVIGLIVGYLINFLIYDKRITDYQTQNSKLLASNQELQKWQIPENLKYKEKDSKTNQESRYMILPKSTHNLTDGTKLYQIYNGGL